MRVTDENFKWINSLHTCFFLQLVVFSSTRIAITLKKDTSPITCTGNNLRLSLNTSRRPLRSGGKKLWFEIAFVFFHSRQWFPLCQIFRQRTTPPPSHLESL